MDVEVLWKMVLDKVRERTDFDLGLWQTLQAVRPLTYEDDCFVVGIPHESADLKGRLAEDVNHNMIVSIMRSLSPELGQARLRVIDGGTLEDWEREKQMDEARRAHYERQAPRRAEVEETGINWETFSERLSHRFTKERAGRYPQTQAEFLLECFPSIREMEAAAGDPDLADRRLARVFNRLAGLVGIPAAQVALEYLRWKKQVRSGG